MTTTLTPDTDIAALAAQVAADRLARLWVADSLTKAGRLNFLLVGEPTAAEVEWVRLQEAAARTPRWALL